MRAEHVVYIPEPKSRGENRDAPRHRLRNMRDSWVIWGIAPHEDDVADDTGYEDDGEGYLVGYWVGKVEAG